MKNITAGLVKNYVLQNPILVDYLRRDLINTSALAREILPVIQKENPKASLESISIAIKRLNLPNSNVERALKKTIKNIQVLFKSNLILFSLRKSTQIPTDFKLDETFYLNQGSNETTIIIDKSNEHKVKSHLSKKSKLCSISLKDPSVGKAESYRTTPGFVYVFLSNIVKEGINIQDMISTHSQFTFIVEEKDGLRTLEICKSVIEKA